MGSNYIGEKLIALRDTHRMSQEDLAERCGVDVGVIRNIENNEVVPSLAPLIKITRALGIRLGTLLDDDSQLGPAVTRAGEAESATSRKILETGTDAAPLDFFSLAQGRISRHMDPFMIDVAPTDTRSLSAHEGEEFIYVISGVLEIEYGKDIYTLNPGDSIYYDSIVPHQVRNAGDSVTRILAVVYAPA